MSKQSCTSYQQWRRQNFAPGGGARARGARVPKFVLTKSSRNEKSSRSGKPSVVRSAKTNMAEVFLQQSATVTGDFDGLTSN